MAKTTNPRRRRVNQRPVEIPKSRLLGFNHPIVLLILCPLLLAGIASRVHLLGRSLWLDEAWVANSMQAPTLSGAFFYDDWLQTSPPLFIALGRASILLLGTSNVALRVLPACFGVLAILLFVFIAFKFLKPTFALIGVLLFVVSPRVIVYSQSLKQYSSDVLATVGLLVLALVFLDKRSDRWFWGLFAGAVALSFLSYPAMLFFPFVLLCAFTKSGTQSPPDAASIINRLNWLRGVSATAMAILVCLTIFYFFIAPNNNPSLAEFFHDGFSRGNRPAELLSFYWKKFSTLPEVFFFGGPGPLRVAALWLTALGFGFLWTRIRNLVDINCFYTACLFTAPIASVVALNLLGVFPMSGFQHRVLLFLFPVVTVLFCFGLQSVVVLVSRFLAVTLKVLNATVFESIMGGLALFAMIAVGCLFFSTVGVMPFFAEEHEDSEEAVAFLRERVGGDDVLFVHPTMREQFKHYTRFYPIVAQRIIHGNLGKPCCPRHDYRPPEQESEKEIIDEISSLKNAAAGRRLWVLMTNRRLHWVHMRRNDIEMLDRGLILSGCQRLGNANFTGVYLAGFACEQG